MLKLVKVNKDRMFPEGLWEVLSETRGEYQLQHLATGKKITISIVHTYRDYETAMALTKLRKERAAKIGCNKR